jgi:hypothetical protein
LSTLNLKPTNAPVKAYYATLQRFAGGHFDNEGNIRGAFEDLLKKCARQFDWTLVSEYPIPRKDGRPLSVDAARVFFRIPKALLLRSRQESLRGSLFLGANLILGVGEHGRTCAVDGEGAGSVADLWCESDAGRAETHAAERDRRILARSREGRR